MRAWFDSEFVLLCFLSLTASPCVSVIKVFFLASAFGNSTFPSSVRKYFRKFDLPEFGTDPCKCRIRFSDCNRGLHESFGLPRGLVSVSAISDYHFTLELRLWKAAITSIATRGVYAWPSSFGPSGPVSEVMEAGTGAGRSRNGNMCIIECPRSKWKL